MLKSALSLLSLLALSFPLVACVAQSPDEIDAIDDEMAESADESVGEAEQAMTAEEYAFLACYGQTNLLSGHRVCFNGVCSTWGNGTKPANITCNQSPYSNYYCDLTGYPNTILVSVRCPNAPAP